MKKPSGDPSQVIDPEDDVATWTNLLAIGRETWREETPVRIIVVCIVSRCIYGEPGSEQGNNSVRARLWGFGAGPLVPGLTHELKRKQGEANYHATHPEAKKQLWVHVENGASAKQRQCGVSDISTAGRVHQARLPLV